MGMLTRNGLNLHEVLLQFGKKSWLQTKAYSDPSLTSKTEPFAKIVNVRPGSEYVSDKDFNFAR